VPQTTYQIAQNFYTRDVQSVKEKLNKLWKSSVSGYGSTNLLKDSTIL